MKTWAKVTLSLVTVGVTATALYFGLKELKKMKARKIAAKPADTSAPAADKDSAAAPAADDKNQTKTETKTT